MLIGSVHLHKKKKNFTAENHPRSVKLNDTDTSCCPYYLCYPLDEHLNAWPDTSTKSQETSCVKLSLMLFILCRQTRVRVCLFRYKWDFQGKYTDPPTSCPPWGSRLNHLQGCKAYMLFSGRYASLFWYWQYDRMFLF